MVTSIVNRSSTLVNTTLISELKKVRKKDQTCMKRNERRIEVDGLK